MTTETDQPTTKPNPPAAEQSNNPAPAETASTLDVNAESFLHDFNPDGVLESDEDDDAQLARDAIDLEASLNDAEASPVVTLVDRILLQAMSVGASDIHVEPQSMEISSETAGNAIISDAILASRGMVQEGVLLSNALIRQKVLPDMALKMLAIGEETGEMDKMLSKVADFYEDEVGAMVKALTSMLEPAMIVVVGGIVGSILLAMYLPMFTVFDQIQ